MECHRYRDRHVDADHARLDPRGELPRGIAVAGEDRGAVAEFVRVDETHRFHEVLRTDDAQHRAEDLLLVDPHFGTDLVEEAAAEEKPRLVSLKLEAAPVDDELRPLLDPEIDIGAHLLQM